VTELRAGDVPFALPDVLEVGEHAGRSYAIERRLPGAPLLQLLRTVDGAARDELVEHHLDAVAQLATLPLEAREWFGDLLADPPLRCATWPRYLRARAADNLGRSTPEFAAVDAGALADALPDVTTGRFVHLDAFAGNVLAEDTMITAVLDIGATSVVGDARLDPVAAAVYLVAPEITPTATARDAEVATSWLRASGLADCFVPAQRWLAAFWSFAVDDVALHAWCRRILLAPW
jgi:aminoglycoside phosphotransferase (APT) family kinase protein